jgi:hypothetical protein
LIFDCDFTPGWNKNMSKFAQLPRSANLRLPYDRDVLQ